MDAKEVASLVGDWGFEVSGSSGSSLGALWELSGSSLGALWELVAVAHILSQDHVYIFVATDNMIANIVHIFLQLFPSICLRP